MKNMNEYISREAIIKQLEEEIEAGNAALDEDIWINKGLQIALKDIRAVEAADVQLVVHAYWIELPKALNPNENPCKCSNCGHILSFMNNYPKSKHCDDCGARMDGDIK